MTHSYGWTWLKFTYVTHIYICDLHLHMWDSFVRVDSFIYDGESWYVNVRHDSFVHWTWLTFEYVTHIYICETDSWEMTHLYILHTWLIFEYVTHIYICDSHLHTGLIRERLLIRESWLIRRWRWILVCECETWLIRTLREWVMSHVWMSHVTLTTVHHATWMCYMTHSYMYVFVHTCACTYTHALCVKFTLLHKRMWMSASCKRTSLTSRTHSHTYWVKYALIHVRLQLALIHTYFYVWILQKRLIVTQSMHVSIYTNALSSYIYIHK